MKNKGSRSMIEQRSNKSNCAAFVALSTNSVLSSRPPQTARDVCPFLLLCFVWFFVC